MKKAPASQDCDTRTFLFLKYTLTNDRRREMVQSIVITSALQEKFETAWKQRQILFFSAPCGFGKSAAASVLLEGCTVCRWDIMEADAPEPQEGFSYDAVLLDNFQALKNPNAQQSLCEAIRQHPEIHFVLLSRGAVPGWLMPFRYEPRMQVFEMKDLVLNQETAEKVLNLSGVSPTSAEMSVIMERSRGYPLAITLLCQQMQDGRRFGEDVDADVRRELFAHFRTAVYLRFEPAARRLLLNLAPFEPFDVEFAQILSGNNRAGELLGELQQDTSMFLYDDLHRCRFLPDFRQYLLWQQEREYSTEEQNRLYSRAALYYELRDDYKNALDCYAKCGEYQKVSDLLIKNSELHPGMAHYDEMETYYRALPREQVLASPALMSGMSMLCSICLDYEGSEAWYRELQDYATKLKRSDPEYKAVRGRIAYLDIGLPQRSVNDFKKMLPSLITLLTNREIVLPEFSVTSRLPSIMNGGKDFCEWSKEDSALYRKFRIPVSLLLGRDGVKLPELAIAESRFEKGEDVSGRVLDLMACLDVIQKKGTPDIEFALIGLLARLRIDQGEASHAREHLEALRERFQRPECLRFMPNLDAFLCRVAMYEGNEAAVDVWYKEKAPKDLLKLRVMLRYQYLTRAMVDIAYGSYQEALLVMAPLRPYFTACRRVMDLTYLNLLTAICRFRAGDGDWKAPLHTALDTCLDYQFVRPVSQYGVAILPLLLKCGWSADSEFLNRLIAAARRQATLYPDFMRFRGELEEPLLPAEMNVLRLLCHHKSNAEIGEILGIKLPTVKTHVSNVLRKLGVKNRGAVKDAALQYHLI